VFLQVVEPGGGSAPRADIELASEVVTLGRDGALAEVVFHDRSVSRLHARIMALNGVFLIYDAGSTSGTWINYAPLPPETGHALQPGDLINLGRVQLRFQRRDAPAPVNGARVARVAPAANGSPPAAPIPDPHLVDAPASHPPSPDPIGGPVETPE
jgi:pSer/pThr/pTyr-binding forkhead associated (FHA) protein